MPSKRVARYFLIPVGVENYPDPALKLSAVRSDLREVTAAFTECFGYEVVELPGLSNRAPTGAYLDVLAEELKEGVRNWLRSAALRPQDVVVFYFCGHGVVEGDDHWLCTADYDRNRGEGGVESRDLVTWFYRKAGERQVGPHFLWLILNTCFSGKGLGQIIEKTAETVEVRDRDASVLVLASAGEKEYAQDGVFGKVLAQTIRHVRQTANQYVGPAVEFIPPSLLFKLLQERLEKWPCAHRALHGMPRESRSLRFLAHPNYKPRARNGGLTLDELMQRDLDHFKAKAGRSFTGRSAALRNLKAFVSSTERGGTRRLRVVTGSPGSGKSAVLGRIVTGKGKLGVVSLYVHARGSTLEDLIDRISAAPHEPLEHGEVYETPSTQHYPEGDPAAELAGALRGASADLLIIVDALDEAEDPVRIAQMLWKLLEEVPGLSVIVGTRRNLLPDLARLPVGGRPDQREKQASDQLEADGELIDLDRPEFFQRNDIVSFCAQKLQARPPQGPSLPQAHAFAAAEAIADRVKTSFLFAQVLARTVARGGPRPETLDDPDSWSRVLPKSIGEAFEQDFERYENGPLSAYKVAELLRPLAYAQGHGIPWANLWPALASALSDTEYDAGDVADLTKFTGFHIRVEAGFSDSEQPTSVYRCFHEELADHLRRDRDLIADERAICEALIATVPARDESLAIERPRAREYLAGQQIVLGWPHAHPYLQRHLATHAARAGIIDRLATDPCFLAWAEPARLLDAFNAVSARNALAARQAYQLAVRELHFAPDQAERLSILQMAARFAGQNQLANLIDDVAPARAWSVPWAVHSEMATHRVLGHAPGGRIYAVALGRLGEREVVVTGGSDGTVRIWEPADPASEPRTLKEGHTGWIFTVALGRLGEREVVVTRSSDGMVRIWELADPVSEPRMLARMCDTGPHSGSVTEVALGKLGDREVVVTGGSDGTVRIWEPADPASEPRTLKGHTGSVFAIALGKLGDREVVVTGGSDGTVRIWEPTNPASEPRTLEVHPTEVHPTMEGYPGWVNAVALGRLGEREVVVISSYGMAWIWEPANPASELRMLKGYTDLEGHPYMPNAVALGMLGDRDVVVIGGNDGTVRIWEADAASEPRTLKGHYGPVNAVALGRLGEREVVVSGGDDGMVRIWGPADPASEPRTLEGNIPSVNAIALGRLGDREVVVSCGDDGMVRIWESADPASEPWTLEGHTDFLCAVALGRLGDRDVVVIGGEGGTVRIWEPADPASEPRTLKVPRAANAVALGRLGDRDVVVIGGDDGMVLIWEPANPASEPRMLKGHTGSVFAIALGKLGDREVVVIGGDDGTVRIWEPANPASEPRMLKGHTGSVHGVVLGRLGEREVVVSGAADRTVRIWEPANPASEPRTLKGHTGWVYGVALGRLGEREVVVSGAADRTVRIWDPEESAKPELHRIPIFRFGHRFSVRGKEIAVGTTTGVTLLRLC